MLEDFTVFQAQVLALMAWADGNVDDDEKRMFAEILNASPGSDLTKETLLSLLDSPVDLDSVVNEIEGVPKELACMAIKNAYLIAMANGDFHEKEKEVIAILGLAIGITDRELPRFFEMLDHYFKSHTIEQELLF